jgi:hypothetical protein
MTEESRKARAAIATAIAVTFIGGVGVLVVDRAWTERTEPPTAGPTSSASTPDAAPTPPTEAAQPDPAVTAQPVSTPVELADSVDQQWCLKPGNTGFSWRSTSPKIAGKTYGTGFSCTIAMDPAQGWVTFTVPEGATVLEVGAGQSIEAPNTTLLVRFEVVDDVSGAVLESHDVAFGQLASFRTPVSGVLRVSLRVTLLDYQGELRHENGNASWGSPTFSHA